jgi:hypothetical protein
MHLRLAGAVIAYCKFNIDDEDRLKAHTDACIALANAILLK